MENLKIRINSENESKEAQELFFELGYKWIGIGSTYYKTSPSFEYITAYGEGKTLAQGHGIDAEKEITIPQLRDMVILKRNDPKDANVYQDGDIQCLYELYLTNDGVLYFHHHGKKEWFLSNLNGDEDYYKLLKPITKEKTFKEYLQKLDDGSYKLVVLDSIVEGHEGLIEVPEGAEISYTSKFGGMLSFDKTVDGKEYYSYGKHWYPWGGKKREELLFDVVWQRENPVSKDEKEVDNVNHPEHYTSGKIECIDALESATIGKSGIEAVCTANIIKYLWRYESKNGIEDVKKAQWYMNKLIEVLKNENK